MRRSRIHTEAVEAGKVDQVAEIQWFYPDELDQVPEILSQEGVIPYSGGTGILWGGLTRVRGLMDIGGLDLTFARVEDGSIALGAALSYSEAAAALAKSDHLLSRSLTAAASEPLRNRISLGGSISMFPYWSDLMGPLLALEAELSLVGAVNCDQPLAGYVRNRELRRNTLITTIRWSAEPWQGAYYRHTRTPTDRPAFSITILLRQASRKVEEIRIVVVGCADRYQRLTELERALTGSAISGDPAKILNRSMPDIAFPARMGFSGEYLKTCAIVELGRSLTFLLQSEPGSSS